MSRHEGVSCDSCLISNFRGRRYKCLVCYDYDLCANCYEAGATSTRHSADHPMQCIITRSDFDIYYGGEVYAPEQPQSFTCPYCKKMGLSDSALLEHVSDEHTNTGLEVVCPVCAALPNGEPNLVTDDFAGHLTLEHRTDEPSVIRHGGVRRIPHSGRGLGGARTRRSNMHFGSSGNGLSTLSPSGRDFVDPIAELLQQLSGARRGGPPASQLQQLQMQIQMERQQARQQFERLPRRQQPHPVVSSSNSSNIAVGGGGSGATSSLSVITLNANNSREATITSTPMPLTSASASGSGISNQQFLMARYMVSSLSDAEQENLERDRADRSQYVQALMLSTIAKINSTNSNKSSDNGINADDLSDDMLGLTLNASVQSQQPQQSDNIAGDDKKNDENCDNLNKQSNNDIDGELNEDLPNIHSHNRGVVGGGGGGCVGLQQSTKSGKSATSSKSQSISGERRGRPPPPTTQSTKRELKASSMSSKQVPDSR